MKKIISTVLTMALCLSVFVGCAGKQDPLAILLETGKTITYGMEKSEVEKLLGKPTEENKAFGPEYAGGIQVFYRSNKVAGAAIDSKDSHAKIGYGISIGDSIEQCKKIMRKPNTENSSVLSYFFHLSNGNYVPFSGSAKDILEEQKLQDYIEVNFFINENGIITSIMFSDMKLAILDE